MPTAPSIMLAVGALLAFLANEPLLVALGHRGHRRLVVDGHRARVRLAVLSSLAIALGSIGIALAPRALVAAAIVGVPVVTLLGFAWRRAEHTLAGELVAAIALTGAVVPVLVASGASIARASHVWIGWALGFSASVVAVHRVLARHKRPACAVDIAIAVAMIGALVAAPWAWSTLGIALPLVALSTAIVIATPSARRLRTIGVAIVIAALASMVLAVV